MRFSEQQFEISALSDKQPRNKIITRDPVARLQKTVNVWQTEGSPQRVRLRTFPGRGRFASRRGELSAPTLNNDRHFSESF
jgi:hypothetical protein